MAQADASSEEFRKRQYADENGTYVLPNEHITTGLPAPRPSLTIATAHPSMTAWTANPKPWSP